MGADFFAIVKRPFVRMIVQRVSQLYMGALLMNGIPTDFGERLIDEAGPGAGHELTPGRAPG